MEVGWTEAGSSSADRSQPTAGRTTHAHSVAMRKTESQVCLYTHKTAGRPRI